MLCQISSAHEEVVTSLSFSPHAASPHVLCSTSGDDTAALWDYRNGRNITRLRHHRGPVNHALFLPEEPHMILTASDDRTIGCWDVRRPDRVLGTLTGFHDGVNKMLQLPNASTGCGPNASAGGMMIASACDDGLVYIHALVPPILDTEEVSATTASLEPDTTSTTAVAAPAGFAPRVPSAGTLVDRFWVSTSTVNDLALSPNRGILITASEDCALRTWKLLYNSQATTEERMIASLDEFENPINHIAVVPVGLISAEATEAAGSAAAGGREEGTSNEGGDEDEGSPTDGAGAAGTNDANGGEGTFNNHHNSSFDSNRGAFANVVTTTTAASGGATEDAGEMRWVLAACSEFVFATDFAVNSGEFGSGARSFVGHRDYVRGLEFTAAGTLLTVSDDSTVVEWEMSSGNPLRQVKLHDGLIMASALSSARDVLATGTDSGEIRLWRLPFRTEQLH